MKQPRPHTKAVSFWLQHLQTHSEKGLAESEATKRLHQHGLNRLTHDRSIHPIRLFFSQFNDFMVLALLVASVISFFLGEVIDGLAIAAILLVNAVFGFGQEYRAERSLQALQRLSAPTTTVIRDGQPTKVPSEHLVPGDIMILTNGDRVPADARLIQEVRLEVDESVLTGESVPVEKDAHHIGNEKEPLAEQKSTLFMGTVITRGRARAVVVRTGMHTEIGEIAELIRTAEHEPTPLQRRLEHLGKRLVAVCLVIVAFIFGIGVLRGFPMYRMFLTGVSLAVAAIPEGLPAVVTAALAIGVQRMIRRRAIVRRLPAVETLGSTTVICTDKTGTLTRNEMTVRQLYTVSNEITVTGTGYTNEGGFRQGGRSFNIQDDPDMQRLLHIGMLCNTTSLVPHAPNTRTAHKSWRVVGDPTEGALLVAGAKAGLDHQQLRRSVRHEREHPFDPQRRRMSVVVQTGGKRLSYVKGAPGFILDLCTHVQIGGRIEKMTPTLRNTIQKKGNAYASQALRVLGFAYKELGNAISELQTCETKLVFVGLAALLDPPRDEVKQAIRVSRQAGIRTMMLTGDHPVTAAAIARQIGLSGELDPVVTGAQLDDMTDNQLTRCLAETNCFARVSPRHKLRIVRALRRQGETVAMTGDGVNDAPAVKEADIGISMGQTGSDVTKEASDIILSDDNYATIVSAVEEGRAIYENIRKFIRYLLGCNAGEVISMVAALLVGLPLPLLPLQILWMNLVTDGLPAIALGLDPVDRDIMRRPPRPVQEGIFARQLWKKIVTSGIVIGGSTLLVFTLCLRMHPDDVAWARTIAFTTLVVSQLIYAFQCRSEHRSAFEAGILKNKYLVWSVLCSFAMQCAVIYWRPLAATFRTTPLTWGDWLIILLFSTGFFAIGGMYRSVRPRLARRLSMVRVASMRS